MRLTEAQARGILELRLARLTGLEREKIQAELAEVGGADPRAAGHPRQLSAAPRGDARRAGRGARGDRLAAADAIVDARRRPGRREADRAGADGRHHHPRRLHQAHPARDLPRAESRRARPHRRRHARRRRGDAQLQRPYASMGAVLQQPAARRSARRSGGCPRRARPPRAARWSICCPSSAATRITTVLPLPQDESLWDNLHLVFATASGHGAAQPAVGFPQRARLRA